jgi:hypothetical protein
MAESHQSEVVGGVVVVGLIALAAYWFGLSPGGVDGEGVNGGRTDRGVATPPVEFGVGGTYRNVKFGACITADMEVTVELGVGVGPLGATVRVIRFSGKDGTVVFFPDRDVHLGLECGTQTLTWSRADGFGREVAAKLTGVSGRVEFEAKVGWPTPALTARRGTLTFDAAGPRLTGLPPSDPPTEK